MAKPGNPNSGSRATAKQGSSVWRILGAVGAGVALIALPIVHANGLMERTIRATFPEYEVAWRSTWPRLLGGASASDVVVRPFGDEEPDEEFRFERVTLKVPFFQYYKSLVKRWNGHREIDDVEMVFEGGRGSMTMPLLPEAAVFGNVSLSPFEAEGCLQDSVWVDVEFADMGLPDEPLTMTLRLWREDGRAMIGSTLAKPGVGELRYLSVAELKDKAALLSSYYTDEDEPISEEWQLRDDGFVAARNRHCARKDGIDETEFVERHVYTVKRGLEMDGVAPTAELEAAYRGYSARGGTLEVKATYTNADAYVPGEDDVIGDLLEYVRTEISINGAELPYSVRPVAARNLPAAADTEPTFATLRREWDAMRGVAAATTDAVDGSTHTPSSVPAPAVEAPVAAPVAVATEAFIAPPVVDESTKADTITDYRELGKQAGQRFVVHLRNKSPMRVVVVGLEGGLVRVRRNLPSGSAEHVLDRAAFVRAERAY